MITIHSTIFEVFTFYTRILICLFLLEFRLILVLLYLESIIKIYTIFQMGEQLAKEKYLKIISDLQKTYEQNESEQKLYEAFKGRVSKEFKLEITCDSALEAALQSYYKDQREKFFSTQFFGKKLKFILQINQLFRKIEFISRREYFKLNDALQKQINSPANKWIQGLSYLKNSADRSEFRYQFLTLYSHLQEEVVQELSQNQSIETEKQIKKHYQKFFTECLKQEFNPKIINYIQDTFCQFQNKSEMLSPKLIMELQKKLGTSQIGKDDMQIKINHKLRNVAEQNAYLNDQEAQQRLDDQIKILEKALKKFSGLNIFKQKKLQLRLGKFGSLTSGFAGIDADLDLTILTNCYINQIQLLRLLHEFLRKQYKGDDSHRGSRRISLDFIQHAKTPLIQVVINERGKTEVKIDIIVNNILGIINSKFLSVYASVKWIKNLGILVKLWGKNQNLIGKNYLSSYAMILMLIHYLIKAKKVKPILDNRVISNQKPFFEYKRFKQTQIEKFKVYYAFKKEVKDVTLQERVNYYRILLGFTHYYAFQLWKEKEENRIITVDQSIDREVDNECVITIKDPFDQPHNPGRMKIDSKDFFTQKFKDAYSILEKGDQSKIEQLFLGK